MSVSSLALVELLQLMSVVQGFPLNEEHIIFGYIFLVLFSDLRARGLSSFSTRLWRFSEISE